MKTKKILFPTTVACLMMAMAAFTFYSCKKKPLDGVNVIANVNFTTATIGVQFINASSGENVGFSDATQEVKLNIIGPDANKIVTVSNDSDFKSVMGFLSLALKEGVTATDANPINFTIVATAKGFVPTSVPITVSKSGGIGVEITMVEIANAPAGVGVKVDDSSLGAAEAGATGGTSTTISISTAAATSGSDLTTATIAIPAGQKFYTDATKSVRVTEAIEVTMAKFSPTEEAALSNFPGTLQASFSDNSQGEFKTAGLISIDMKTASGLEVTSFEKPVDVTMGIPSGATKLDGSAIAANDTIPIWSHNKTTGQWTYEGKATVVDNGGNLETTYQITHLSSWNLDYYRSGFCGYGATINFTGNVTTNTGYYVKIYDGNGNFLRNQYGLLSCKAGTSIQLQLSTSMDIRFDIYKTNAYKTLIGQSANFNGCTGNVTIDVNVPSIPPVVYATVTARCASQPNKLYRPTLPVYAQDVTDGTAYSYLGFIIDGQFSSNKLIVGHTYNIFSVVKNQPVIQAYTITSTTMDIELDLGAEACSFLNVN